MQAGHDFRNSNNNDNGSNNDNNDVVRSQTFILYLLNTGTFIAPLIFLTIIYDHFGPWLCGQ